MTGGTEKRVMTVAPHEHVQPIGARWALAMVFTSMFLAVVFSVVYSNYAARQAAHQSDVRAAQAVRDSEQILCGLLVPLDDRYHKLPPQAVTSDVSDFITRLDDLIDKYDCKGK